MRSTNEAVVEWARHSNGRADFGRWGMLAGAAVLVTYGVSRRSLPGAVLAAAATPLAYRGLSGRWSPLGTRAERRDPAGQVRRALSGDRGIRVREAIRLELPLAEVYRFWRRLENLPQFMAHLESVTDLGNGRSHWVAKGPAGKRVEWDAEIINDVENQVIAWRYLPGADVDSAGSVNFDTMRAGQSTQVTVSLQYAPPAGRAGGWAAMLARREPSQMIREDLRRLKQLLEAGEVPRATPSPELVGGRR
jgi:uncharacterized membrane protein